MTNIGRENEAETQFRVIVKNFCKVESCFVVFEKKKGPPWEKQINLGLSLENRGKNYGATVCNGKGK